MANAFSSVLAPRSSLSSFGEPDTAKCKHVSSLAILKGSTRAESDGLIYRVFPGVIAIASRILAGYVTAVPVVQDCAARGRLDESFAKLAGDRFPPEQILIEARQIRGLAHGREPADHLR